MEIELKASNIRGNKYENLLTKREQDIVKIKKVLEQKNHTVERMLDTNEDLENKIVELEGQLKKKDEDRKFVVRDGIKMKDEFEELENKYERAKRTIKKLSKQRETDKKEFDTKLANLESLIKEVKGDDEDKHLDEREISESTGDETENKLAMALNNEGIQI